MNTGCPISLMTSSMQAEFEKGLEFYELNDDDGILFEFFEIVDDDLVNFDEIPF